MVLYPEIEQAVSRQTEIDERYGDVDGPLLCVHQVLGADSIDPCFTGAFFAFTNLCAGIRAATPGSQVHILCPPGSVLTGHVQCSPGCGFTCGCLVLTWLWVRDRSSQVHVLCLPGCGFTCGCFVFTWLCVHMWMFCVHQFVGSDPCGDPWFTGANFVFTEVAAGIRTHKLVNRIGRAE